MESRAKAFGHAIHPMLIVFPLGLLTTAVVFDVLHLVTERPGFAVTAAYVIAAGVVGGVVASLFGVVDWRATPRARARGASAPCTGWATRWSWCCSRGAGCCGWTRARGSRRCGRWC
ncbi:DUF2231 domain-containing protein [Actinokineospora soli]|uniref:DUF2231 domain-containing protein n=1 Tax=Actinokineospora soli TaxID=1048753 RepID=A0ABW2TMS6_9PSEU